jgi:putative endonuclease
LEPLDTDGVVKCVIDFKKILESSDIFKRRAFLRTFIDSLEVNDGEITFNYGLPPDGTQNETVSVLGIVPPGPPDIMYSVYILRSELNERYYIGSTKDIKTRLSRHNAGHTPSTKAYRPWKLVYSESFSNLRDARKREQEIKSWKNPKYMAKILRFVK